MGLFLCPLDTIVNGRLASRPFGRFGYGNSGRRFTLAPASTAYGRSYVLPMRGPAGHRHLFVPSPIMATLANGTSQPRRPGTHRFTSPAGPDATPLQRFAAMCTFDPATGCVTWTGGTSSGHGNSARYGVFWDPDEKRKVYAHRWSAIHIHGLDVASVEVGHCCPRTGGKPNTLCVEHVKPQTKAENVADGNRARVQQSAGDRQFYLFVSLGLERPPELYVPDPLAPLFYEPPAWFTAARPDYVLPPLADVPF